MASLTLYGTGAAHRLQHLQQRRDPHLGRRRRRRPLTACPCSSCGSSRPCRWRRAFFACPETLSSRPTSGRSCRPSMTTSVSPQPLYPAPAPARSDWYARVGQTCERTRLSGSGGLCSRLSVPVNGRSPIAVRTFARRCFPLRSLTRRRNSLPHPNRTRPQGPRRPGDTAGTPQPDDPFA